MDKSFSAERSEIKMQKHFSYFLSTFKDYFHVLVYRFNGEMKVFYPNRLELWTLLLSLYPIFIITLLGHVTTAFMSFKYTEMNQNHLFPTALILLIKAVVFLFLIYVLFFFCRLELFLHPWINVESIFYHEKNTFFYRVIKTCRIE